MRKFNHISIEKLINTVIVTAMGGTVVSAIALLFYNLFTYGI